jgi:hemerythrin superfamily protein
MSIDAKPDRSSRKRPPGVRQIRRAAGIKDAPSAIDLLRRDHRAAEALFKAFKRAEERAEKREIARKVCAALAVHAEIEEEIFYPAFIEATGQTAMHREALVEHDAAKKLIAEIEAGEGGDEALFDARVTVLAEMIKHHVKEEERFGGLFSKARLAKMDLKAVGALLLARKRELEGVGAAPPKRAGRGRAPKVPMGAALARSKAAGSAHARRPA